MDTCISKPDRVFQRGISISSQSPRLPDGAASALNLARQRRITPSTIPDIDFVRLSVNTSSAPALQLYERLGFLRGANDDGVHHRAVVEVVAAAESQLGPIDVLINGAGSFRALGNAAQVDPEEWWREVEINLRGPFVCAHAALPGMIARRRGRIINIVERRVYRQ